MEKENKKIKYLFYLIVFLVFITLFSLTSDIFSLLIVFLILLIPLTFCYQYIKKLRRKIFSLEKKVITKNKDISNLQNNIEKELKKARDVHQKMLPDKIPEPKDLHISTYYHPAEILGGDYYNVFPIEHGAMSTFFEQYLFYYFDVSGHGIDSALLAIFINDAIENYFKLEHNPGEMVSPAEIINYINIQYQNEGFPEDYLVCIFLGVIDMKKYELTYTSAGFQFPVFELTPQKEVSEIATGDLPLSTSLGKFSHPKEEKVINLHKNNTFLFSTDGLLEQKNGSEMYNNRIKQVLKEYHNLPPAFLNDIIQHDFFTFTGKNNRKDDITFLLLGRSEGKFKQWEINHKNSGLGNKSKQIEDFLLDNNTDKSSRRVKKLIKNINNILVKKNEYINKIDLKIKAVNNSQYMMLNIADKSGQLNWGNIFNNHSEFTSLKNRKHKNLPQDKPYISYSNFGNKVYFLVFK